MGTQEQQAREGPGREAVRRQLEKILAADGFARSARISRFLRFTVERALEGRAGELKEYLLGVEVFDRKASYDSRVDPIVRVEARRLRAKLREYYESDGRDDPLIIDFPTGGYAPCFRARGAGAAPEASAPGKTVAVLPFANLSTEPDNEYFSDGLTEELIRGLTKVEGLRVAAWQSAAQLRGRDADVRGAGERLHAAAVLTGSVRRAGNRLRVTAQLIDTASGVYLWSETYDRALRDVFAIQDEISRAIVSTLQVRLAGRFAPARPARNLEAWNLFLRGRYHFNRRAGEELRKSLECYQEALTLDPSLAVAHAALADTLTIQAEYGLAHPAEAMPKAEAAARRALELDPQLAEAWASLALIRSIHDWEWSEAEGLYRRSIELNPGYASAHHWFALDFLAVLGRTGEARAEIDLAYQLDPLSAIILECKGYLSLLERQYERALEYYREVLELDATFFKAFSSMGRAYAQMGRYEEAVGMLRKARLLAGDLPSILGALGQTYALAGQPGRAREALGELRALGERCYVAASCFALVHAGLGENGAALDWLERGCAARELPMISLKMHPAYDSLRREPRYQALVERVFGGA